MRPHTTHHEDCGCLSERFAERIAELEENVTYWMEQSEDQLRLIQRVDELQWELERMKVCGTCGRWNADFNLCDGGGHDDFMRGDRCHFNPSRWDLAEELRDD